MPRTSTDLSLKEQLFVCEFLKDGNATRAATAAGYAAASASVTGSKLQRKARVAEELAKLREKLLAKHEISAEKILQAVADVAFFDPRKFFDGARLKAVTELDDVTVKALKGCDVEKLFKHFGKGQAEESGTITKIRFADRLAALEMLGRHKKLFTDKIEISDASAIEAKLRPAGRGWLRQRTNETTRTFIAAVEPRQPCNRDVRPES